MVDVEMVGFDGPCHVRAIVVRVVAMCDRVGGRFVGSCRT